MRLSEHKTLIWGMPLVLVLLLGLIHLSWKGLIGWEANRYGYAFIEGLIDSVKVIDETTKTFFNEERYNSTKNKPLARFQGKIQKDLLSLEEQIKRIANTKNLFMGLYTHCSQEDQSACYIDSDVLGRPHSYEPESRPWYLATRKQPDWVILQFMRFKASRISGYPTKWGFALSKRLVLENENLEDRDADTGLRQGIWVNFYLVDSQKDTDRYEKSSLGEGFLNMVHSGQADLFYKFDVSFKSIRFYPEMFTKGMEQKIECRSVTDYDLFSLNYSALVSCPIQGEEVQFVFSKRYNSRIHLFILIVVGFVLFTVFFIIFKYIEDLQQQNSRNQLVLEKAKTANLIGTKMIHDLKKGIMSQLNQLPQQYAEDLETEFFQPDFRERLQTNLDYHFNYLQLLNKYIKLLTNNLNRQKEKDWKPFNLDLIRRYLEWLTGESNFTVVKGEDRTPFMELVFHGGESLVMRLTYAEGIFGFAVPEMAFFRILKNLWENYNAYGKGDFVFRVEKRGRKYLFKAFNHIKEVSEKTTSSTELGLKIIQQMLEDNYGVDRVRLDVDKKESVYTVLFEIDSKTD